ncbi:MAG TPA: GTPase ObgE [Patescibacteria group bacterium]|nr:GTPase ObgE [Patescibacteria group bacterium]
MFVDKAEVRVKAGNGGDGRVSFRQEKFVDRGGPDGGDGGKGGDVLFVASRNQNTLANFRYQKELNAEPGKPGDKRKKHGKSGINLVVLVPVGTTVFSAEGKLLADLTHDNQEVILAKGGPGGFGNAHFISSTRQAPKVAEKGEKGEEFQAILELKMIADVGLVGLPNAGKSTLLSTLSNARPEIADYPFTTLTPNLGVVDIDKKTSLLFADIPGLIEGASQGKGLGDEFLRHVERTVVLLHLVDIYNDDIATAYKTIQAELKAYKIDLTKRPQLVALNKIDGFSQDMIDDKLSELRAILPAKTPLFAISAKSRAGVDKLLFEIKRQSELAHKKSVKKESKKSLPVLTLDDDLAWQIKKTKDGFVISGKRIEKFANRTDFSNPHGVERLRDIMRKMGITHELIRQNIAVGNKIIIGNNSFEY